MSIASSFARFGKRFAASGAVAEPTTNQADSGLAFLGANPPAFGVHNALWQWCDDKDNWLYGQIEGVLTRAGITPSADTLTDLRDALVSFSAGQQDYVVTSQSVTAPAWATRALVAMRGGGGGGGGSTGTGSAGSGGGGGEYREGVVGVTAGGAIYCTIGGGGIGGVSGNGTPGGTTAFGGLMSAFGGAAGGWGNNGIVTTAGTGGAGGSGPGYSAAGSDGGLGVLIGSQVAQGVGGASYQSGANVLAIAGAAAIGNAGTFRGVGGNGGVGGGSGGAGRSGEIFIRWLP